MKKMWLSALVISSALAFAGTAQARSGSGVLFDVNLYYGSTAQSLKAIGGTETKSENSTAMYDIKLGYLTGSGLYWGGIYSSKSYTVLNAEGTNASALGASLGYFGSSGFFIMGHYLASATHGKDLKDGTGFQADLGYKAGVGGNWLVGGELTYRSISFKKDESIGVESYTLSEVVPMLSIGYLF